MPLTSRNVCVLALATAFGPDDCYFCGYRQDEHVARGKACPEVSTTRQPPRHYQAIGWQDYETLGLEIGCYYNFRDDLHTWFDAVSLSRAIDTLLRAKPLIVSYQGAVFAGPLMWQCYRSSADGLTALGLDAPTFLSMQSDWQDLWDRSYDLLEEILLANPDIRFARDALGLDQLCRKTLGVPRLLSAFQFQPLWRRGLWGQALTALQFDVWAIRALFEKVCNGQALTLGNGQEMTLPLPPEVQGQP